VTFRSVAGATSGQAIVGNVGAIADRLEVDPATGAILRIENMAVRAPTASDSPEKAAELEEQRKRVVLSYAVAVDLNGTLQGTAYLGGTHGTSAFHGVVSSSSSSFEQHVHAFGNGGTEVLGTDVKALAFDAAGDLWTGELKAVTHLPQRSLGAGASLFQSFDRVIDVWPGTDDNVEGIGVDGAGTVWVASFTNGLARLGGATFSPTYVTSPSNQFTSLAIDRAGRVWLGSVSGLHRYTPSTNTWELFTTAHGLPSNGIRAVRADGLTGAGSILVATSNGVAVVTP
jgi:ligand-binding sensor domain-containing protein